MVFHFISRRDIVLLDARIDGPCNGPSLKRDKKICRKFDKFGGLKKKNPIKIHSGAVEVTESSGSINANC